MKFVPRFEEHAWQARRISFYRDCDGWETDFVLVRDRTLHPIEVKKTTQQAVAVARTFQALDRLQMPRGHGAVVCLAPRLLRLDGKTTAVPVGFV